MNAKRIFWCALTAGAVVLGCLTVAWAAAARVQRPRGVAQVQEAVKKARQAAEQAQKAAADEAIEAAEEQSDEAGESAEEQSGQHETERGDVINLKGDVDVAADEDVKGDVVAIGGSAHVRGSVNGNVVSVDGDVHLYDGAKVKGDVIALGGEVKRDAGAEVGGSKLQVSAPWTDEFLQEYRPPEGLAPEKPPAPSDSGSPAQRKGDKERVVFGENVRIERDEVVNGDVVVFGGSVDVRGKVTGDTVAFGGPIDVRGQVNGDAVCIGGRVHLHNGATVRGDAVSVGGSVTKESGAELGGQTVGMGGPRFLFGHDGGAGILLAHAAGWIAWGLGLLVVTVLVVLVLPRQTDVIATSIATEPGRVALFGLVGSLLVLPVLVALVLLIVTWLVIPFYLAAVVALGVMGAVGINVVIGRRVARLWNWRVGSVLGLALIGFAVLRLVDLAGIFPPAQILTALIWLAVLMFGFGGALMTRFGTDPTGLWLGRRLSSEPPPPPASRPSMPDAGSVGPAA